MARPIGPRMAEALEFIRVNPGVCKADVFRGTGVRHDSDSPLIPEAIAA